MECCRSRSGSNWFGGESVCEGLRRMRWKRRVIGRFWSGDWVSGSLCNASSGRPRILLHCLLPSEGWILSVLRVGLWYVGSDQVEKVRKQKLRVVRGAASSTCSSCANSSCSVVYMWIMCENQSKYRRVGYGGASCRGSDERQRFEDWEKAVWARRRVPKVLLDVSGGPGVCGAQWVDVIGGARVGWSRPKAVGW